MSASIIHAGGQDGHFCSTCMMGAGPQCEAPKADPAMEEKRMGKRRRQTGHAQGNHPPFRGKKGGGGHHMGHARGVHVNPKPHIGCHHLTRGPQDSMLMLVT